MPRNWCSSTQNFFLSWSLVKVDEYMCGSGGIGGQSWRWSWTRLHVVILWAWLGHHPFKQPIPPHPHMYFINFDQRSTQKKILSRTALFTWHKKHCDAHLHSNMDSLRGVAKDPHWPLGNWEKVSELESVEFFQFGWLELEIQETPPTRESIKPIKWLSVCCNGQRPLVSVSSFNSSVDRSHRDLSNGTLSEFFRPKKVDHYRFRTFSWALQVLVFTSTCKDENLKSQCTNVQYGILIGLNSTYTELIR